MQTDSFVSCVYVVARTQTEINSDTAPPSSAVCFDDGDVTSRDTESFHWPSVGTELI